MATYYIDYENVHNAGLRGLDCLSAKDYVYIFYSEYANTFNVESMKLAMNSVCGVEFVETSVGTPNAMDFQIVTLLYATIDADDWHYIISKDRGFDVAIKMGERCNCSNVERHTDIIQAYNSYQMKMPQEAADVVREDSAIEAYEVQEAGEEKNKIKSFIQNKCGVTMSEDKLDVAYSGLTTCTTKKQLYNYLRSHLGSTDGNKLYKLVGENYTELKDVV